MRTLRRLTAGLTGALAGVTVGMLLWDSDFPSVVVVMLVGAGLMLSTRLIVRDGRPWVYALVLLAFTLRAAAAAVLYHGSLAAGGGGFISGDDADYAVLAWNYALYLAGQGQAPWIPPFWNGNAYLFGTYVHLESFVFAIVGPNVLLFEMLNAGFGTLVVLLVYDLARRAFDERAGVLAAGVIALYPSLVLWSALNLKDALSLAIIMSVLWCLSRFHERPRWWYLLAAFLLLLPMESLRRYVFLVLEIALCVGVAVAPRLLLRARVGWATSALALSVVLATNLPSAAGSTLAAQVFVSEAGALEILEYSRHAMAVGARTGFQDDLLTVKEGDTFVVRGPSPSPSPPIAPAAAAPAELERGPSPRVVHVAPNARVIVVPEASATPAPSGREVYVQPGDIVVVGPPSGTVAPVQRVITESTQMKPGAREDVVPRTLDYLPRGLAYALLAPFPWELGRPLDLLTLPEMLVWYLVVIVAAVGSWTMRRRWRSLAPLVLYVAQIVAILALAEGNWGTLFRHRSMIIPVVVVLAAPQLLLIASALRSALGRIPGTSQTPA